MHIKALVRYYFKLEKGALIKGHTELIPVLDNIFISRRALKHFVERRREELLKKHTRQESLTTIYFIVDSLPEIIKQPDCLEIECEKYILTKDYYHIDKSSIRIILELRQGSFEIVSIHFKRKRNKK